MTNHDAARAIMAELSELKDQADVIERRRRALIGQLREMRRGAQASLEKIRDTAEMMKEER